MSQQPPEEDAEEDDPRWELIRQLVEYKKFKDAAQFLQVRDARRRGVLRGHAGDARPQLPGRAPCRRRASST